MEIYVTAGSGQLRALAAAEGACSACVIMHRQNECLAFFSPRHSFSRKPELQDFAVVRVADGATILLSTTAAPAAPTSLSPRTMDGSGLMGHGLERASGRALLAAEALEARLERVSSEVTALRELAVQKLSLAR